jgi:hypothetical protein
MSIQADEEFSLRMALAAELANVLPSEGLANLVIKRRRKIRRRRVAGAVSLVVVGAGIGVPLGLSGPNGTPPQHHPSQRPDRHTTGSVTVIPHTRAGAVWVIQGPASVVTARAS